MSTPPKTPDEGVFRREIARRCLIWPRPWPKTTPNTRTCASKYIYRCPAGLSHKYMSLGVSINRIGSRSKNRISRQNRKRFDVIYNISKAQVLTLINHEEPAARVSALPERRNLARSHSYQSPMLRCLIKMKFEYRTCFRAERPNVTNAGS